MAATDQVIALLTRIAEGVDTQNELLSALIAFLKSAGSRPEEPKPTPDPSHRIFTADYIEVGFEKGKKVYRIWGQPFMTYGVRVWPEVLPRLGLSEDLDMGQHEFTERVSAECNDRGNPVKVIGLAE